MSDLEKGDRVRLISMPDDPNPIPAGSEGTVRSVSDVGCSSGRYTQVSVNWDNGRSLSLVMPPDMVEVINANANAVS